MNKQNRCIAIGAAVGMLVLIFDGKTAFSGAAEGIRLCINTLIPSLFPFFILSNMLTGVLSGQTLPLLRTVTVACKIPDGAQSLLAIGLLGGYPVGAQNVALQYSRGQLSRYQASRMLAFCNNAGPAFIFGILGSMFSSSVIPWLLWLIHIVSALVVGIFLPGAATSEHINAFPRKIRITNALSQSVKAMSLVCGWVILMRTVLAFIESWFLWLFPVPTQVIISGILELSNGCIRLAEIDNEGLRFLLAAGFLSFGGICVTLQTASVADEIPMKLYFPGKILQCSISILLACFMQMILPVDSRCHCLGAATVSAAAIVAIFLFLRYSEKSSGIPAVVGI